MFKFSLKWLNEICGIDIDRDELFKILNLQGFEAKGEQVFDNDRVITIEVKANRPDILSHIGLAREICAFKEIKIPEVERMNIGQNNLSFPVNVEIQDDSVCRRFSSIVINGIDNTVPTPRYIKERLELFGINSVNPVVDISNYTMLEFGQPMHTYDIDKISGNTIKVFKSETDKTIVTLGNKEALVKKGDIIISDNKDILCVAGIIGTDVAVVDENTKNILIESAIFDSISIRLTSRRMKISTPSSFRFERGVNIDSTKDIAYLCAKKINEVCGGKIYGSLFDNYKNKVGKKEILLRTSRANELIGCALSQDEIIEILEKYDFDCRKCDEERTVVSVPTYRLDVLKEVDIIEEIARIYGYDNIEPVMPNVKMQYKRNNVWDNIDILRNMLVGLGFNEIISYSFIPDNITKFLGIEKDNSLYSELKLQNAISPVYRLMRPTMVYSLISSLAYNYSRNNTDLSLFEIGRTYFVNEDTDTKCEEFDTLGIILSGNRIERGWGIGKDVRYNYYDLLNYVNLIFKEFGQEFKLKEEYYPFLKKGSGCSILNKDGIKIGFLGEINKEKVKNIQNVKLVKDDMFYCEICIKYLESKNKLLKFESKFPNIKRDYNLLCKKSISSKDISDDIKNTSKFIVSVTVKDIYDGKDVPENSHAVLYEIIYCSQDCTLTSEEIVDIENKFLHSLSTKFDIKIKY